MQSNQDSSAKSFFFKVLNGTALGILIGLLPNAILTNILKHIDYIAIVKDIIVIVSIFQIATPAFIGAAVGWQFKFDTLRTLTIAGAAFAGSGVIQLKEAHLIAQGTGNIPNTMIVAALTAFLVKRVGHRFGSADIVLLPLLLGTLSGLIGLLILPSVDKVTLAIGAMINYFTTLQPYLLSILIAISFCLIIISPISTVSIGLAIQMSGLAAGAAAMGIAATTLVLIVHSWKVNSSGVTLAIALGSMKMMMPNLFKYPIIAVPMICNAIICALTVPYFSIQGLPTSAGFGLIGLVGPLTSIEFGLNVVHAIISWFIIPTLGALLNFVIWSKIFKIYDYHKVFKYEN